MEIVSLGQQAYKAAEAQATRAGKRLVEEGPDADAIVSLKLAEQQAELAAKVIKAGVDVNESLLDILA